jgi:hypothetical protein
MLILFRSVRYTKALPVRELDLEFALELFGLVFFALL